MTKGQPIYYWRHTALMPSQCKYKRGRAISSGSRERIVFMIQGGHFAKEGLSKIGFIDMEDPTDGLVQISNMDLRISRLATESRRRLIRKK